MIYITGDTHRNFDRIEYFCGKAKTATEDILIILGDAGINFFGGERDEMLKLYLASLPITLFCIHGNHEMRPWHVEDCSAYMFHDGIVYGQKRFPNLHFAKDGEVYDFAGHQCLVIGGAYSVDKQYRLERNLKWFDDEQPDDTIKLHVLRKIDENPQIDIVLSHTCPQKYVPTEMFLRMVDQSTVDKSTEQFLDRVEESVKYQKWYCGHWHTDKSVDKMRFVFNDFLELGETE